LCIYVHTCLYMCTLVYICSLLRCVSIFMFLILHYSTDINCLKQVALLRCNTVLYFPPRCYILLTFVRYLYSHVLHNDISVSDRPHTIVVPYYYNIILINQLDATLCSLIYSLLRFTVHVSGAFCTHHQEYN
jgi:hypothetical protein